VLATLRRLATDRIVQVFFNLNVSTLLFHLDQYCPLIYNEDVSLSVYCLACSLDLILYLLSFINFSTRVISKTFPL